MDFTAGNPVFVHAVLVVADLYQTDTDGVGYTTQKLQNISVNTDDGACNNASSLLKDSDTANSYTDGQWNAGFEVWCNQATRFLTI